MTIFYAIIRHKHNLTLYFWHTYTQRKKAPPFWQAVSSCFEFLENMFGCILSRLTLYLEYVSTYALESREDASFTAARAPNQGGRNQLYTGGPEREKNQYFATRSMTHFLGNTMDSRSSQ